MCHNSTNDAFMVQILYEVLNFLVKIFSHPITFFEAAYFVQCCRNLAPISNNQQA